MNLTWHEASESDLPLLANWNHQLIQDERHRNPMNVAQPVDPCPVVLLIDGVSQITMFECPAQIFASLRLVSCTTAGFQLNDAVAETFLGSPVLTGHTHGELKRFARRALGDANAKWKKEQYPALIENALRQLLASSPDLQTS